MDATPTVLQPEQVQPSLMQSLVSRSAAIKRIEPVTPHAQHLVKRCDSRIAHDPTAGDFAERNYGACMFCATPINSFSGPFDPDTVLRVLLAAADQARASITQTLNQQYKQQSGQFVARPLMQAQPVVTQCVSPWPATDPDNSFDVSDGICTTMVVHSGVQEVDDYSFQDEDDDDYDDRDADVDYRKPSLPPGINAYYCSELCWYLHLQLTNDPSNPFVQMVYRFRPDFSFSAIAANAPEHYALFRQLLAGTGKSELAYTVYNNPAPPELQTASMREVVWAALNPTGVSTTNA